MNIVLLRHGNRALLLPAGRSLIDCPLHVRLWLGTPQTEVTTQLTADTPMPGIHPPLVLAEILQNGFCALDMYGFVRGLSRPLPRPPPEGTRKEAADANATDLPQDEV
ncbi:hypothetical protein [Cupriavidus pauculus]|uniref:hypothetical protein n=1 Tax=Cupriavidus pauculus TaxID=82633 RepID=UPI001EE239B8|nr:hypothetical protein [Cupriavidus pauculus]GJG98232.1 hypothetical protein CBA19C6_27105 [Cupriavidus pauculus]